MGFYPGAEGGRRASFTDVNSCADDIVCPENLEEQREERKILYSQVMSVEMRMIPFT